jgi:phage tail-like protein
MQDANGSRFQLLLGRGDWGACRLDAGSGPRLAALWRDAAEGGDDVPPLQWDRAQAALRLGEQVLPLRAGRGDLRPDPALRRGAAADRFGNVYAVTAGGLAVEVRSAGTGQADAFWPPAAASAGSGPAPGAGGAGGPAPAEAMGAGGPPPAEKGGFAPVPAPPPAPRRWRGLAVTADHHLVVGIEPDAAAAPGATARNGGLLVFDLAAGGPPLELAWPAAWPFAPWALAARPGGGLAALDRRHARVWWLDERLGMQGLPPQEGEDVGSAFAPLVPPAGTTGPATPSRPPWFPLVADAQGGDDPLALLVLPDDSVLVLDGAGADGFARVSRYIAGLPAGHDSTAVARGLVPPAERDDFRLVGFDFTAAEDFEPEADDDGRIAPRVVIAAADGNQGWAFDLVLQPPATPAAPGARMASAAPAAPSVPSGQAGHRAPLPPPHAPPHATPVATPSLALRPLRLTLPLRRYAGRSLVRLGAPRLAGDTGVVYHAQGRWVPLVAQRRPRYTAQAALTTPALDGRETGCRWHRLVVDGCLPPGCRVVVHSRAADDPADLPGSPWRAEPPLLPRPGGSEIPWLLDAPGAPHPGGAAADAATGHGSFELLLQAAAGRHLQLRLVLEGNELATPRLVALRAWTPRFAYAQQYLPAIWRRGGLGGAADLPGGAPPPPVVPGADPDEDAADFIERFLANFEGQFTALEDRIVAATALFDVRSAPAETLDWLAGWLGLVLDPALDEARRRQLIAHALALYRWRGTPAALALAVQLALSPCRLPDTALALPGPSQRGAGGVRLVERFLARRLSPALRGETVDFGAGVAAGGASGVGAAGTSSSMSGSAGGSTPSFTASALRSITAGTRWTLAEGAAGLHRRWREHLAARGVAGAQAALFAPLPPAPPQPGSAQDWADFCSAQLGAVPGLSAAVATAWARHVAALPAAAAAGVSADLPTVWPDDGREPPGAAVAAQRSAWSGFVAGLPASDPPLARWLARWQGLLARRHLRVEDHHRASGAGWPEFALVPPPATLPGNDAALADWAVWETTVEPIAAHAHRFSVLLPLPGPQADPAAQAAYEAARGLAQRVLALEQPAHTQCDVRPYWSLFRVGQVRLGLDTLLGAGSRDAALAPLLVLGHGQVGAARVAGPVAAPRGRIELAC